MLDLSFDTESTATKLINDDHIGIHFLKIGWWPKQKKIIKRMLDVSFDTIASSQTN